MTKIRKNIYMAILIFTIISTTSNVMAYTPPSFNDFEDQHCSWMPLYNNADFSYEKEDNGNTYLNLRYNGLANRNRKYYDVRITNMSGLTDDAIQTDFDIMFTDLSSTSRDGEIQFKKRTGPGSAETTVFARLAKTGNNFQVQSGSGDFQRVRGLDNQYLTIEEGHWYTVNMTVDLAYHNQTIYISDRDSEDLLAVVENIDISENANNINMITFSSGTNMCLDNVRISCSAPCAWLSISGEPYLRRGASATYKLEGRTVDGSRIKLPEGSNIWSIEKSPEGVSIDESTGEVTVSDTAEPGVVILQGIRETSTGNSYVGHHIINISN